MQFNSNKHNICHILEALTSRKEYNADALFLYYRRL